MGEIFRCLLRVVGKEGDPPGANGEVYIIGETEDSGFEDFDGLARVGVFEGGVSGLGVVGGEVFGFGLVCDQVEPRAVGRGEIGERCESGRADAEDFCRMGAHTFGEGGELQRGGGLFLGLGKGARGRERGFGDCVVTELAEGFGIEEFGEKGFDFFFSGGFGKSQAGECGGFFV